MTGTVGVVAVTAGPGLTNTVTAIKNAQMAESPILLLGWLTNLLVFLPVNYFYCFSKFKVERRQQY
jgi:hypothetical protein